MKNLSELFQKFDKHKFLGSANICPTALITDSRRVLPGTLFFALNGLRTCGSAFAEEAIQRGALAIVASEPLSLSKPVTQVIVPDVAEALALAAEAFYDFPMANAPLVGVTGTNGKTSVTSMIRYLMMKDEKARPWGLIGTVRYELGHRSIPSYKTTPESVDIISMMAEMRDANCAGIVMEVSSHAIAQKRIFGLPFDVVAFTNLTQDHMDYHGDMENYFSVKSRLFSENHGRLPKFAVINVDDPYGKRLISTLPAGVQGLAFGFKDSKIVEQGGYFASDIVSSSSGSEFNLSCSAGTFPVKTKLPGDYNVSNVLCALACAEACGKPILESIKALADFPGVHGRMERVPNSFPFEVFVDYAHTDDALENALRMLKKITKGRLFAVFGCGGNRDRGKRPKMVKAVQKYADFAWATSDNPRKEPLEQIFEDMCAGVYEPQKIEFIPDRRRAIGKAIDEAREDDVILIAGKGHETYQEFADITLPFDDCAVAQEFLELRAHRVDS